MKIKLSHIMQIDSQLKPIAYYLSCVMHFKTSRTVLWASQLFLIIILSTSCEKKTVEEIQVLESNPQMFNVSVERTINLSNETEAIIGQINSLQIFDNKLYLLDTYDDGVSIFSIDGSFIKKTRFGKGPGELIMPVSCEIYNNMVHIMDQANLKSYTLDLKYIKTRTLPNGFFAQKIVYLQNGKFLACGASQPIRVADSNNNSDNDKNFRYHIIDTSFRKEYNSFVPVSLELLPLECDHPYSNYNNQFLLVTLLKNNIYLLDNNQLIPKYYIDFGQYAFTSKDLTQDMYSLTNQIRNGQRLGYIDNINHVGHFLTFSYLSSKGKVFVVFSKEVHKVANISEILKNNGLPKMNPIGTYEESFLFIFKPSDFDQADLDHFIDKGIIPQNITIESNPVIFILEFSLAT